MASIITNFQSPQTLDELMFAYYEDDMRSNLDFILNEQGTITVWTVDKRSKKATVYFL